VVPTSTEGAFCPQHPDVAAVSICSRCGVFLCGDCLKLQGQAALCPACFALARRAATRRAVVALVLAYCGLQFCFPPLGVAGLAMGYSERRRALEGESTQESEGYVRWAIILGWINAGVLVIGGLVGLIAVVAGVTAGSG
jgi:B-box zinc finger protein